MWHSNVRYDGKNRGGQKVVGRGGKYKLEDEWVGEGVEYEEEILQFFLLYPQKYRPFSDR